MTNDVASREKMRFLRELIGVSTVALESRSNEVGLVSKAGGGIPGANSGPRARPRLARSSALMRTVRCENHNFARAALTDPPTDTQAPDRQIWRDRQ